MSTIYVEGVGFVEVENPDALKPDEIQAITRAQELPQPSQSKAPPPIPQPIDVPTQRDPLAVASQFVLRNAPQALGMFGGMAGPQLAAQALPKVAPSLGELFGSTLGVGAGSAVGELARTGGDVQAAATKAQKEAVTDAQFTAGIQSLARGGGKLAAKALMGVDSPMADKAARFGIDLGLADVSSRAVPKGARSVIGRIPIISAPFKRATSSQMKAAKNTVDSLLDDVAPHSSISELGIDTFNAAKNQSKEYKRIWTQLYNNADKQARGLNIVRTRKLREAARETIEFGGVRPVTTEGKVIQGAPADDAINDIANQLTNIQTEDISVDALRTIQKDLNRLGDAATDDFARARIKKLRQGTEDAISDLNLSQVPAEQAQSIVDAYRVANKTFGSAQQLFDSPAARHFKRVDRNIFNSGAFKAQGINADEVGSALIGEINSAQGARDLRRLIGDQTFNKVARAKLDGAFSRAMTREGDNVRFNPLTLRKELGFDFNSKGGLEAANEVLRDSKMNAGDMRDFFDALDHVGELVLPSTFLARRAVLGGPNSALKALVGATFVTSGASGNVSLPAGIAAVWLARKGGQFLTSPDIVKGLTKAMRNELPAAQKTPLFVRALRLALQEREPAPAALAHR